MGSTREFLILDRNSLRIYFEILHELITFICIHLIWNWDHLQYSGEMEDEKTYKLLINLEFF